MLRNNFAAIILFILVNLTLSGIEDACGNNKPLKITNSTAGFIQSPNYPENYPNNADCSWLIELIPGTRLQMYIDDVSIENG